MMKKNIFVVIAIGIIGLAVSGCVSNPGGNYDPTSPTGMVQQRGSSN